jgi:hypothetical protein
MRDARSCGVLPGGATAGRLLNPVTATFSRAITVSTSGGVALGIRNFGVRPFRVKRPAASVFVITQRRSSGART